MSTQLVPTAISGAEFTAQVKAIKDLQRDAYDGMKRGAVALIKYAMAYQTLYERVRGDGAHVNRLNEALDLTYDNAARLRGIAARGPQLKGIADSVSPSIESLYHVSRAMQKNPTRVLKAIENGQLTRDSPNQVIRQMGKANVSASSTGTRTERPTKEHKRAPLPRIPKKDLYGVCVSVAFEPEQGGVMRWDDIQAFKDALLAHLPRKYKDQLFINVGKLGEQPHDEHAYETYVTKYWSITEEREKLKGQKQTAESAARLKELKDEWGSLFE